MFNASPHEVFTSHLAYSGSTASGYDTSTGTDAICWLNALSEEAKFDQETFLMKECYPDVNLNVSISASASSTSDEGDENDVSEQIEDGVYMINTSYDFRIQFEMSESSDNKLTFSGDSYAVTTASVPQPRARLLLCDNEVVGFCSMNTLQNHQNGSLSSNSIVSNFVNLNLNEVSSSTDSDRQQKHQVFDGIIRASIDQPGSYTVVGFVELNGNATDAFTNEILFPIQLDIANSLSTIKSIDVRPEPYIYGISHKTTIATLGIATITCFIMFFFLYQTIRHRYASIISLSQWPFLMLFIITCLIANVSSFAVYELNAQGCKLFPVIVNLCHGLLYSTLIARTWRIYQLISPLLKQGDDQEQKTRQKVFGLFDRFVNWENCFEKKENSGSINLRITNQDMGRLIFMLFCPMLFAVLLTRSHDKKGNKIILDEEYEEGVIVCEMTLTNSQFITLSLYFLYQLLLLFVAYLAKDLPSFLNETASIFRLTWTNCLVCWISGSIIYLNLEIVGNPDLNYAFWVGCIIFVNTNTVMHIMLPKLRRVWNGEIIIANDLLEEYKAKKEERNNRDQSEDPSVQVVEQMASNNSDSHDDLTEDQEADDYTSQNQGIVSSKSRILIKETNAVPRRVLIQLLNANEIMKKVISRSMYGKQVTKDDWELLKEQGTGLGIEMDSLIFSWHNDDIACKSTHEEELKISDLDKQSLMMPSNILSFDDKVAQQENDVENPDHEIKENANR